MFDISLIEALWIGLNSVTLVLTLSAYGDAKADQAAVKKLNGHARELAAGGIVRRERTRVVVQGLLLATAVPSILADRPNWYGTYAIVLLMAVSVVLLINSVYDAKDRKALAMTVAAELLLSKRSLGRIEVKLEDTHEKVVEIRDELQKH